MRDAIGNYVGKKFEQGLFDKTNQAAIDVLTSNFKTLKLKVNPDIFGIDILCYLTDSDRDLGVNPLCAIEVDVKMSKIATWVKGDESKSSVDIFLRKRSHFNNNIKTYHVTFNADYSDCMTIDYADIALSKPSISTYKTGLDAMVTVSTHFVDFGCDKIETRILRDCVDLANSTHQTAYKLHRLVDNSSFYDVELEKVDDIVDTIQDSFKAFNFKAIKRNKGVELKGFLSAADRDNDTVAIRLDIDTTVPFDWIKGEEPPSNYINISFDRKDFVRRKETPFYIAYNADKTDCLIIPYSVLLRSELKHKELKGGKEDWVLEVPVEKAIFGFDNLEKAVLEYLFSFTKLNQKTIFGIH